MYASNSRLIAVFGLGLMALCVACQSPAGSSNPSSVSIFSFATPARSVESLRRPDYVERSVLVSGAVSQRLALVDSWLYQLDDRTGQVWILTQQEPPDVGTTVNVWGIVRYEAVFIGDADLGDYYLQEEERQ